MGGRGSGQGVKRVGSAERGIGGHRRAAEQRQRREGPGRGPGPAAGAGRFVQSGPAQAAEPGPCGEGAHPRLTWRFCMKPLACAPMPGVMWPQCAAADQECPNGKSSNGRKRARNKGQ
jgi:hypothetical protein